MSKLTGDIIVAGMTIWTEGYRASKRIPLALVVVSGEVSADSKILEVKYASAADQGIYGPSFDVDDESKLVVYLGDRGVRPYNYDNRRTQIFTTEQEMLEAIADWAGDNPNFLKDEE